MPPLRRHLVAGLHEPDDFISRTAPEPTPGDPTPPRARVSTRRARSTPTSRRCSTSARPARACSGPAGHGGTGCRRHPGRPHGRRPAVPHPGASATTVGRSGRSRPSRRTRRRRGARPRLRLRDLRRAPARPRRSRTPRCAVRPSPRPPRYLAFALDETEGAPLLVALDRDIARSRVGLRTAITTAPEAPAASPPRWARLAEPTHERRDRGCRSRPGTGGDGIRSPRRRDGDHRFRDDPRRPAAHHRQPERAEILQLLGVAWLPAARGVVGRGRDAPRGTTETLGSVGLLRASPIQLITSGAVLPVWVRNDLPYPVNLILYATPDNLRLECSGRPARRGAAEQHARRGARAGADRQRRGDARPAAAQSRERRDRRAQTREVHVRAEWEGIGLVVIVVVGVGFVLLASSARSAAAPQGERGRGDRGMARDADTATEPTESAPGSRGAHPMSGIGRASVLIGAGTIVSRLSGFLRAVVLVSAVGATRAERATRSRSRTSCRTTSTRSSRPAC